LFVTWLMYVCDVMHMNECMSRIWVRIARRYLQCVCHDSHIFQSYIGLCYTYEWVYVTHMSEECEAISVMRVPWLTYISVVHGFMLCIWMSVCHAYEWRVRGDICDACAMTQLYLNHICRSRYAYEWVMSHIYAYEWVMSHICARSVRRYLRCMCHDSVIELCQATHESRHKRLT